MNTASATTASDGRALRDVDDDLGVARCHDDSSASYDLVVRPEAEIILRRALERVVASEDAAQALDLARVPLPMRDLQPRS